MRILVINCGSSSIKYRIFDMPAEALLEKGTLEHIGEPQSNIPNHYAGLKIILERTNHIDAIGHRVVHGGEAFSQPTLITPAVIRKIRASLELAPLHNPANLEGILACQRIMPKVKQVAVFDTAFHQTLPEYAYLYALPYRYYQKYGIRKYGFHGTSHQYVASRAAEILKRPLNKLKIITCHLGNGCSITAIAQGKSVDTSMGFTPLEGLIMGTRCGDIDPAVVTYLMKKEARDPEEIEETLNKESGLKGISGLSNDMRVIQKNAPSSPRARLAIEMFVYRIRKYIGAYLAVLGGADAIVFTGGIGENQTEIRQLICKNLFTYLKKPPRVLIIPTNEELLIALHTYRVVGRRGR